MGWRTGMALEEEGLGMRGLTRQDKYRQAGPASGELLAMGTVLGIPAEAEPMPINLVTI